MLRPVTIGLTRIAIAVFALFTLGVPIAAAQPEFTGAEKPSASAGPAAAGPELAPRCAIVGVPAGGRFDVP